MKEVILVVDMIKGFLVPGYPLFCGEEARRIIPAVVSLLRRKKNRAEIIYLCDRHRPDDREFRIFPPHCLKGSVESELIDELAGVPGTIVSKTRYSGFYGTRLSALLKRLKPDRVTVVGVCTDICVLHTVAGLRNRDYEVTVPSRAVASFNPESHLFALEHMKKILGAKVT